MLLVRLSRLMKLAWIARLVSGLPFPESDLGVNPWLDSRTTSGQRHVPHARDETLKLSDDSLTIPIARQIPDPSVHKSILHKQQRRRLAQRWAGPLGFAASDTIQKSLQARSQDIRIRNTNSFEMAFLPILPNTVAIEEDGTDISYFCTMRLGSAGKSFKLVIDTGSSDTWVPATSCSSAACLNHSTFGATDSSTFMSTHRPWTINYGSGSVTGEIVKDYMSLEPFTMTSAVAFGTASVLSSAFASLPSDGILGLANSSASAQKVPTFMDNLVSQGLIERKLFAINLQRAEDSLYMNGVDGQISFGLVDTSKYDGSLVTVPNMSKSGLWEALIEGIHVNGQSIDIGKSPTGIIDTGTTLLLFPPTIADRLHAAIPGALSDGTSTYTLPCDTIVSLSIAFGGTQFAVDSRDYVGEGSDKEGMCLSNIIGQSIGVEAQFLIGDVLLKNVYTVFDFDNQEIGFGAKGQPIAQDQATQIDLINVM